jgi:hypothetical protein
VCGWVGVWVCVPAGEQRPVRYQQDEDAQDQLRAMNECKKYEVRICAAQNRKSDSYRFSNYT